MRYGTFGEQRRNMALQCMDCYYPTNEEATFCSHCGSRLRGFRFRGLVKLLRVVCPLLAALVTVEPWVLVGLGRERIPWTLYHMSGLSWGWLCLVVSVALLSGYHLRNPINWWVRRTWQFLGIATFSTSIAVLVAIHMAHAVSHILNAPSPVHLADGLWMFLIVSALWALLAFIQ